MERGESVREKEGRKKEQKRGKREGREERLERGGDRDNENHPSGCADLGFILPFAGHHSDD
eukprot:265023-Amorphochlora_amoeboformis.AAC.1